MPENPFAGSTRDPIALLEQLITRVGSLQKDIDQVRVELKADIAQVRTEVAQVRTDLSAEIAQVRTDLSTEIAQVRTEMTELRLDLKAEIAETRHELKSDFALMRSDFTTMHNETLRFFKLTEREQGLLREHVDNTIERSNLVTRQEWKAVVSDLEYRVAELEAAERRRQQSAGA